MSINDYFDIKLLESQILQDIAPYRSSFNLEEDCVSFAGNPRRHPYDSNKIILIPDPQSDKKLFLEFLIKDIAHIDELPNITGDEGITLKRITIWVKKGSWGVRTEGFRI